MAYEPRGTIHQLCFIRFRHHFECTPDEFPSARPTSGDSKFQKPIKLSLVGGRSAIFRPRFSPGLPGHGGAIAEPPHKTGDWAIDPLVPTHIVDLNRWVRLSLIFCRGAPFLHLQPSASTSFDKLILPVGNHLGMCRGWLAAPGSTAYIHTMCSEYSPPSSQPVQDVLPIPMPRYMS